MIIKNDHFNSLKRTFTAFFITNIMERYKTTVRIDYDWFSDNIFVPLQNMSENVINAIETADTTKLGKYRFAGSDNNCVFIEASFADPENAIIFKLLCS
jgi:hypothetical protein